ncbi:uncharacterized protein LOC125649579 isoform X2 [Ostrea edulis]|uniref:uncharacterized protein LOC125649579 isoform X2 n=1 Tax=Ostrea edulis TaxID=37623 RepID=UPI0024AF32CE|nr:uncharacterized protein LOC125649579 isoform X2 [Ostrea edulis]
MGCGNSKDDVNTKAQGNVKVGSDKNRNTKNSQPPDFSTIAESDDVNSTGKKPKSINNIDGQKLERPKGGKGKENEVREPVNEKGYKKRIREQLKQAATNSDTEELEHAIFIFEKNKLEDNGDLTDAKERLRFLYLRKELRDAILRRHPGILDKAIARVEESEYKSELSQSLDTARKLRQHLTELDQYRHDILTMDQSTTSEIRSYHHPPDGVHEVMIGTYMLLGYEEEKLQDWTDVQCLLGRYGKESLMREIRNADTININSKTSQRVLRMQSKFSLEQIRGVSNGAATFYVWNSNMANKSDKDRQQQQQQQPSQTPTPGKQSGKPAPAQKENKQAKPTSNVTQSNAKDTKPAQPTANTKDKNQPQPKAKDKNQAKAKDKNQPKANPQDKPPAKVNGKNKIPTQPTAKDKNPAQPTVPNKQSNPNKNQPKANTADNKKQTQQNSKPVVNSSTKAQSNQNDTSTKAKSDTQQNTKDRKKTKG